MKATLVRSARFSCGHKYENPNWTEEKNKEEFGLCYSEHGHGHNYKLEVFIKAPIAPDTGMTLNLMHVDQCIEEVTDLLDHKFLNTDLDYFKQHIPTTENISVFIYNKLKKLLEQHKVELSKVTLYENDDLWVEYGNC